MEVKQQAAQHTPGPWQVKAMVGMASGRPMGFTVERLNAARNGCDLFERGRIFRSEAAARAAIAKATGAQS